MLHMEFFRKIVLLFSFIVICTNVSYAQLFDDCMKLNREYKVNWDRMFAKWSYYNFNKELQNISKLENTSCQNIIKKTLYESAVKHLYNAFILSCKKGNSSQVKQYYTDLGKIRKVLQCKECDRANEEINEMEAIYGFYSQVSTIDINNLNIVFDSDDSWNWSIFGSVYYGRLGVCDMFKEKIESYEYYDKIKNLTVVKAYINKNVDAIDNYENAESEIANIIGDRILSTCGVTASYNDKKRFGTLISDYIDAFGRTEKASDLIKKYDSLKK